MKTWIGVAVLAAAVCPLGAQNVQDFRATIRGGSRSSSGKCTIEVRVDGVAEVEIFGDRGRLRTISGLPSTWVRMECSDPMPANMNEFRFRGIDGRGRQDLVRDPRNSRGVAVVRIEDPKAGSEGYTFDLEWSGAMSGPGGGYGNYGGYGGNGRGNRMNAEAAIELCRNQVRTRAQRDYGMRDIDITSIGLDNNSSRRDIVSGSFNERGAFRRGAAFQFACSVDFGAGTVRNVEIVRPNSYQSGGYGGNYDRNAGIRNCQDAVVARMNRDGYQNIRFGDANYDNRRSDFLAGSASGERGRLADNFDFSCTLDGAGRVRSVDVRRR